MFSSFKPLFPSLAPSLCRAAPWALALSLSAGCTLPTASPAAQDSAAVKAPLPAAAPAPAQELPQRLPVRQDVSQLLAYAEQARALSGAALAQEIARLAEPAQPADQLRLALALSQTRQLYDMVRAQELLQRVLASASEEALPLHTLARLLAARFAEQRRVEDQLDRQNLQLRELQRRLEQTQDKLDALKEIERSLNSRPAATPAPGNRNRATQP